VSSVSALDEFLIRDTASRDEAASRLRASKLGVLFVADAAGRVRGHLDSAMLGAKAAAGTAGAAMQEGAHAGSVSLTLDGDGRALSLATPADARRVPIAEPTLGGNELKYVTECVTTNWISSQGSFVRRFETEFAALLGVPHALAVSKVIVPDLTFAATLNAVIYTGATPVLVDVAPDTWNMDPDAVAAAITPRTKAIMPVHLYGQPTDMAPILALAKRRGLVVVEDAAEAVGAKWNGIACGAIGDCGTFSFFSNKLVTTGEGGMVVFKDDAISARARRLRDHGLNPQRRYWHDEVGFNYRLTNLQAAIGCAQLEQLAGFLESKKRLSAHYNRRFASIPEIECPTILEGFDNSYWVYTIVLDCAALGISRDAFMAKLAAAGIDSRPIFYCMHDMPPYKGFAGNREFPVSAHVSANGLSLPPSTSITQAELDFVADTVARLVASHRSA